MFPPTLGRLLAGERRRPSRAPRRSASARERRGEQLRTGSRSGLLAFVALLSLLVSCARSSATAETYPLVGDSAFDMSSLPAETQVWYRRFLYALDSSERYPNVRRAASRGDLYQLGRTVATDVTTILTVFRLTGDLRLLDKVDETMQVARQELRDTNGDGYLNWRWLHDRRDRTWYGDDQHVMDEIMTHGMVAQVAWTFRQNQDQTSPSGVDYEERADFWSDYLQEWEAKWRERNRTPTGFPFIYKNLTHPYLSLVRYLWYSYRLTDDEAYLREATRLAEALNDHEFRSFDTPYGPGLVFAHGITRENPSVDYLPPLSYAAYSTQILFDLSLEPFPPFTPETTLVPLANTIATKVIDNGSTDFAPTLGGSEALAGLDVPDDTPRTPDANWAISPIGELASFNRSDTIAEVNEQVYQRIERRDPERPDRIAIPAAMVIKDLIGRM